MIFSPNLFVMLKILSSEYQLYACGKIFRMPRSWTKIFILQEAHPETATPSCAKAWQLQQGSQRLDTPHEPLA
jgi:hypothetical protein